MGTSLKQNVAQNSVSYYPFKLIDTSSISLIKLDHSYTNYEVESESKRHTPYKDDSEEVNTQAAF